MESPVFQNMDIFQKKNKKTEHIRKQLFPTLISKRKYQNRFEDKQENPEFINVI